MLFGSRFSLCVFCAPRGNDYPYFQCTRARPRVEVNNERCNTAQFYSAKRRRTFPVREACFPSFERYRCKSTLLRFHGFPCACTVETDLVVCGQYSARFENRCDPNVLQNVKMMNLIRYRNWTKIHASGDRRKLKKRQFPHQSKLTKISANRLLPLLNCKHINPLTTFPPARTHCVGPLEILWRNTTFGVRFVFVSHCVNVSIRMNEPKWTTIYATSVLEFRSATAFTSSSDISLSDSSHRRTESGVNSSNYTDCDAG